MREHDPYGASSDVILNRVIPFAIVSILGGVVFYLAFFT